MARPAGCCSVDSDFFTLDVLGVFMIGCVYITHVLYRIAFCMPIEASMGSWHVMYTCPSLILP